MIKLLWEDVKLSGLCFTGERYSYEIKNSIISNILDKISNNKEFPIFHHSKMLERFCVLDGTEDIAFFNEDNEVEVQFNFDIFFDKQELFNKEELQKIVKNLELILRESIKEAITYDAILNMHFCFVKQCLITKK